MLANVPQQSYQGVVLIVDADRASADVGYEPTRDSLHQGTVGSFVSPDAEDSLRATSRIEERVLCSQVLLDACSSAEAQLSW